MENSCGHIIGHSDHGICFLSLFSWVLIGYPDFKLLCLHYRTLRSWNLLPSLLSRVLIGYADGTSCLATAGQGDQTGSGAVALRIVA